MAPPRRSSRHFSGPNSTAAAVVSSHVDETPSSPATQKRAAAVSTTASDAPSTPSSKSTRRAKRPREPTEAELEAERGALEPSAKARKVMEVLEDLYPDPPIPLDHVDHFTLLCAVMLSAQTTDGKVNEVTKALFAKAPTPEAMASLDPTEDVLPLIRSVGLAPTKAKNLVATAQMLVERFGSRVPSTYPELESLPGVGHKTASVVMCQAFGEPSFPVDTHIHRLALRWGLSQDEKNPSNVELDLKRAFPRKSWSHLHLQFIFFGREHCPAKNHRRELCPVCCWIAQGPDSPAAAVSPLARPLGDDGEPRSNTPKKHKGVIFYSDRKAELRRALP